MSDRVDLEEFLGGFVAEAEEHLRASRAALLTIDAAVEKNERQPRAVRDLYRALHTIKGLAAMVGVQPVVDIAHRMESVLRAADQAGGALAAPAIEPLVRGLEALEGRVAAVGRGERAAAAPARLIEALEALEPAPLETAAVRGIRLTLAPDLERKLTGNERAQIVDAVRGGKRALRVTFLPSTQRAGEGTSITTVRERVGQLGDIVRVLPVSVPRSDDAPAGLAFELLVVTEADDAQIASAAGLPDTAGVQPLVDVTEALDEIEDRESTEPGVIGVVRVDVRRLDAAMQRLSALIVTRFKLGRAIASLAERGVDVRDLRVVADEHAQRLRDVRQAVLGLRMIPAAEMLERIPLIVRGLRSTTGKDVRVVMSVGRAELDKAVAERVFPAIVHVVRNAVDHGIEPADARRAAGKPEQGELRISVTDTSGDKLELCIEDDGAGVDPAAVARRAGKPVPDNDEALLDMLVQPGLSTRAEATTTSGRGIGMDIVHRVVVRELGGELSLQSSPGRGTRFLLRIPLTVSIVDALAFLCAEQAFVVPLRSVDEICDLDEVRIVTAPSSSGHERHMIERKGEIAAYFPLGQLFALDRSAVRKVVMVRRNGVPYGFGVDQMIGQQEVVVRPLEDPLVRAPGVTGSTDLGDGRPTLVLDLVALSGEISASEEVRT